MTAPLAAGLGPSVAVMANYQLAFSWTGAA